MILLILNSYILLIKPYFILLMQVRMRSYLNYILEIYGLLLFIIFNAKTLDYY